MGRHHLVSSRRRLLSKVAGVTAMFCVLAPLHTAHARAATPYGPRSVSPPAETVVSIPFDPAVHGFGFGNWADLGPTDDANLTVARRLFGDTSVCQIVAGATCTPYASVAAFLSRLNQNLTLGRCEGIVVAAYTRFRAGTPGTSTLGLPAVIDEINYWSATQILPAARKVAKETRALTLIDFVARLTTNLRNGGGDVLGLSTTGVSHSVLPISLRQKGTMVSIGVYDSNHPKTTQYVDIDLATGTWAYRPRNASGKLAFEWIGKAGTLSLIPLTSRTSAMTDIFRKSA